MALGSVTHHPPETTFSTPDLTVTNFPTMTQQSVVIMVPSFSGCYWLTLADQ